MFIVLSITVKNNIVTEKVIIIMVGRIMRIADVKTGIERMYPT